MSRNGKVVVAMSGGVDSSVAACLLKEQGFECVGVFMRHGVGVEGARDRGIEGSREEGREGAGAQGRAEAERAVRRSEGLRDQGNEGRRLRHGCCSVGDAIDARAVAGKLGIPFYALNFEQDFGRIVEYFVDEYARARTPNPCIMCNTHLKFGKLLRYADMLGAEFVATGHYARVLHATGDGQSAVAAGLHTDRDVAAKTDRDAAAGLCAGRALRDVRLARAANLAKDQSYVLFGIRRQDLPRCLFPIGEMADKAEVRRVAEQLGLRVHDKPDSQEICFVPEGDYRQLVRERRPQTQQPGEVRDAAGTVLGQHGGVGNYTVGQRHGLGIAGPRPMYVTRLDVASNTVTLGPREDLLSGGLVAEDVNWLVDPPAPGEVRPVAIKIRHTHQPAAGAIRLVALGSALPPEQGAHTWEDAAVEARFDEPQSAVTPGQAAVFYHGEVVLGGGWIARAL